MYNFAEFVVFSWCKSVYMDALSLSLYIDIEPRPEIEIFEYRTMVVQRIRGCIHCIETSSSPSGFLSLSISISLSRTLVSATFQAASNTPREPIIPAYYQATTTGGLLFSYGSWSPVCRYQLQDIPDLHNPSSFSLHIYTFTPYTQPPHIYIYIYHCGLRWINVTKIPSGNLSRADDAPRR